MVRLWCCTTVKYTYWSRAIILLDSANGNTSSSSWVTLVCIKFFLLFSYVRYLVFPVKRRVDGGGETRTPSVFAPLVVETIVTWLGGLF